MFVKHRQQRVTVLLRRRLLLIRRESDSWRSDGSSVIAQRRISLKRSSLEIRFRLRKPASQPMISVFTRRRIACELMATLRLTSDA